MNSVMLTSHSVIPAPEPGMACGSALSGGYTVQPALAGPPSTNSEASIRTLLRKKNQ
jgi:hypothetical protein